MAGGKGKLRPEDNPKPFDKYPENRGNGRKKKIYTVIKELGYSADDIRTAFGEMAFYTLNELKEVYADETKPVIARIVANQFFTALKKSDWTKIKEILEHVIGKPKQDFSNSDGTLTPTLNISKNQIKEINDKLENEY